MTQTPTDSYQVWHDMLADERFSPSSGAIQDYLKLTQGLESPTPYHVWSFLSLVSALCGDSIALTHGPMGRERLNLGVVLTGVPAIRKSTALSVMQKFAEGLPISYGPTDTAGQRQGIMSAMMSRWQKDSRDGESSELTVTTLEALAAVDTDGIAPHLPEPMERKASELYFVAKELGRLISSPSRELFDFFTDGMDGESFHYQLKNQAIKIKNPLINLLGATTPSSLGHCIPKGGESHGFLSRLIFVHAPRVSRAVAIPEKWNDRQWQTREQLHTLLRDQLMASHDAIGLTDAARQTYEDLYAYSAVISDQRLQAYQGRRSRHLLKVSALLALLRGIAPVRVQASDVRLAHALLVLTEGSMDRAFNGLDSGFYSKVMCAITELAENAPDEMINIEQIQSYAGYLGERDMMSKILMSLESQGKIVAHKRLPNTWTLSQVARESAERNVRMQFRGAPLGEDEFRTHRVGLTPVSPDTKKGVAG